MRVIWTYKAKDSYVEILEYLLNHWTLKDYENFKKRTIQLIETIKAQPLAFTPYIQKTGVRKALLTQQITLYYKYDELNDTVALLLFFNTYQDPSKINL